MERTFVVYDKRFGFYGDIAGVVSDKIGDDTVLVEWKNPVIQDIITDRFGYPAFVFIVIQDNKMYIGEVGIDKFSDIADIPDGPSVIINKIYDNFADPIGRVIHGRKPADIHDTFEVTSEEKEKLQSLIPR